MDILEYDNDHYVEPICKREDIYLDFITAPIEKEIDCSSITEEDNIYDIIKYFVFKSCNYDDILILYDIMCNKILLLKHSIKIKEYIIIDNYLLIIYNNNENIIIDIENKKYKILKTMWCSLLLKANEILTYISKLNKNKINISINKNNIVLDNNDNNWNIKSIEIRNKNKNIICYKEYFKSSILISQDNKLIFKNNIHELDFTIVSIFNFSLVHVLLLTNTNNIVILNLTNMEYEIYNNYYNIIDMLNDKFYNKIRNSFMIN
ncbi:unknown similar to AMEV090 [Adoxophyes honmai entomopoxvirus 'L']|uniref:Uncharacterized protein n=1 Tax=Adoxophyes honmai entomopoxvirus 'L' TaxID=1293540 RepID=A0A916P0U0_9POXV|nr:unknown similar to AMEV090 [Adoxophyes honmai entomopoxvirus 'L']CCU55409.1 unknown similar to AMEV090 [Adoxophyes honmai entomopoxvirus 'L']